MEFRCPTVHRNSRRSPLDQKIIDNLIHHS
jgi:hypothetical protein